jgi:hypothetical protein
MTRPRRLPLHRKISAKRNWRAKRRISWRKYGLNRLALWDSDFHTIGDHDQINMRDPHRMS